MCVHKAKQETCHMGFAFQSCGRTIVQKPGNANGKPRFNISFSRKATLRVVPR